MGGGERGKRRGGGWGKEGKAEGGREGGRGGEGRGGEGRGGEGEVVGVEVKEEVIPLAACQFKSCHKSKLGQLY